MIRLRRLSPDLIDFALRELAIWLADNTPRRSK